MTYTVIQPAEEARLNAILAELTPRRIDVRCETLRSEAWRKLVEACEEEEDND